MINTNKRMAPQQTSIAPQQIAKQESSWCDSRSTKELNKPESKQIVAILSRMSRMSLVTPGCTSLEEIHLSFLHILFPFGLLIECLLSYSHNCLELIIRQVGLSSFIVNSSDRIAGLGFQAFVAEGSFTPIFNYLWILCHLRI